MSKMLGRRFSGKVNFRVADNSRVIAWPLEARIQAEESGSPEGELFRNLLEACTQAELDLSGSTEQTDTRSCPNAVHVVASGEWFH